MSSGGLKVKPLTTYLGTLLSPSYTSNAYDGTKLANPNKEVVGRYEAVLTQASMLARLAYEINPVILAGAQFIHYNPLIFNTALSIIRRNNSRFMTGDNFKQVIKRGPADEASVLYLQEGMEENGCYFQYVDYTKDNTGPHKGESVLYLVFRGTASLTSGLTDAKVTSKNLDELFSKASIVASVVKDSKTGKDIDIYMTGSEAFKTEIAEADKYRSSIPGVSAINPFGAHSGFVTNMAHVMDLISSELGRYLKKYPALSKIIVTGHSLGGANATLCAMTLAGFKKAGAVALKSVKLHCITFGAPKLLSDYSRNVFNAMLKAGVLTLDRVAGRMSNILVAGLSMGIAIDLVPTIPPNFVHPGYMILKTEIKTQSRTGRSKNISDLRKMFGDIDVEGGGTFGFAKRWQNFNGLPTYPEFFSKFTTLPSITISDYSSGIKKLPFGTLYPIVGGQKYKDVKALVDSVTNMQLDDTSEEGDKQAAAADPVVSQGDTSEESSSEEGDGDKAQAGGGPLTNAYKADTVVMGSNHIVYKCDKNISAVSCHMTYLGISYGGALKNVSHTKSPYTHFDSIDGKIVMEAMAGGRRHRRRTMKRKLMKRRNRKTRK